MLGVPQPPDWTVDWEFLWNSQPWLRPLADCPQQPEYHGEGNVGIHTRMVCEALAALPGWRALPEDEREVVWAAALLHDVAKPECTREENGRWVAPGHARKGAVRAREILWLMDFPLQRREAVTALVKHHMVPGWLLEREEPLRLLAELSQTARCDWLALLSEADMRGRICADQAQLLERVALFAEYAQEQGCWGQPFEFPSPAGRYAYFRKPGRDPHYLPHEDFRCQVTVMSGLPGAGKDTWIARHAAVSPVVSLDALRDELGVGPLENQARVADAARERAREHLRAREDFVWNATNLSFEQRSRCLDLFASYGARIRLVYCEAPWAVLEERNAKREFPWGAVEGLLRRWEVPEPWEAHEMVLSFEA